MTIDEMESKQIHFVWRMNLNTDSCCNFKTYQLENISKHMIKKQNVLLLSTELHLTKIANKDNHFIITIYTCLKY